jgi:YD repeat-containing protein
VERRWPALDGRTATQLFHYDALGRPESATAPALLGDSPPGSDFVQYDLLGRPVLHRRPAGETTRWRYAGLTRTTTTPRGHEQVEHTDEVGRTVRVVDTDGGVTRYGYGPFDALIGVVDAEGSVIRTEYDAWGRRLVEDDPALGRRQTFYDALDRANRLDLADKAGIYASRWRDQFIIVLH